MCPCLCDQTAWPPHITSCVKPNKIQHYNCGQDLRYILPLVNRIYRNLILNKCLYEDPREPFFNIYKKKRLINIEEQHLHIIAYLVFLSLPIYM